MLFSSLQIVSLLVFLPLWNPVIAELSKLGSALPAQSTSNSLEKCCDSAQDATVFALVYGLPLIAFSNQTTKVFEAVGGANKIDTQTELASLSSAAVVKPNVDTLYSRVIVDLSRDDLVLTVPNITDRFYIFPFYDVFGDNFAQISPVNKSLPGKYLLRRADDAHASPGLHLPGPHSKSKYQGVVNFPTTFGTMLIRILVKHNNTANLDIVHKYQHEYALQAIPKTTSQPNTPRSPSVAGVLSNGTATISSPRQILDLLAKIASSNQPEVYADRYRVASILGRAGLVNGKYNKPQGVNLGGAMRTADATINRIVKNPRNINEVGNGWQVAITPFEGNFGKNYAPRAYIAQTGYQQLLPYIALYPGFNGQSFRSYSLGRNESFLFTFSGKPPLHPAGFWSLTIYGADQYLVPNKLNRFEIGDRSSLTYDNGQPVYGSKADPDVTSRPFKVLMQAANLEPPRNWTNNWLPSPAGGGDISFILRWYVPKLALTNGTYVYPKVERIRAITA